jgi:demethylmenaquinone methyltransferase/2-methoxy-6-polyprenyl-1,4-benzoquinol methylase
MTTFDQQEIQRAYGQIAERYDVIAKLIGLIGFREAAYRKRAVAALQLEPGDTVVEIGCGTGMNLALFQRYIGPDGKIVGSG